MEGWMERGLNEDRKEVNEEEMLERIDGWRKEYLEWKHCPLFLGIISLAAAADRSLLLSTRPFLNVRAHTHGHVINWTTLETPTGPHTDTTRHVTMSK